MKRRKFIGLTASTAALAFFQAHAAFSAWGCSAAKNRMKPKTRIKELRLITSTPIAEMKKFYGETIGFPVSENAGALIIQAGESKIIFSAENDKAIRPFYHFAFNIPENKIEKAFQWQRKRTPVIHPSPGGTADQVVDFSHWNAHSVFFLDPAGNLVEYIARHDLANASEGDFSIKDISCVSEIAFIVNDVPSFGESLVKEFSLDKYNASGTGFWPIGDQNGLLLVIRKGRVWAGHPGKKNETSIFKTSVTINNKVKKSQRIKDYPYELIANT